MAAAATTSATSQPVLGYWAIRGLAQPIRLLLAYAEVKYEDKRYVQADPPSNSREEWTREKYNLGLTHPNLPWFKHGDLSLTQSSAILHYVARTFAPATMPSDAKGIAIAEMVEGVICDCRQEWVNICYDEKEKWRAGLESFMDDTCKPTLACLIKELGDKKWILGDHITYVDFMLWEVLDQLLTCGDVKPTLDSAPTLMAYHKRFAELPNIAAYMASPQYISKQLNNKHAAFGAGI